MLPILRSVVEKTTSLVNDERARQHGRNTVELAREIIVDTILISIFNEHTPITFTTDCKTHVCTELIQKIFHAQVNRVQHEKYS